MKLIALIECRLSDFTNCAVDMSCECSVGCLRLGLSSLVKLCFIHFVPLDVRTYIRTYVRASN